MQASPRAVFQNWLSHIGKSYGPDTAKFERRLIIWQNNLQHLFSSQPSEAKLNNLADLTDEEFRQAYLGQRARPAELRYAVAVDSAYQFEAGSF